MTLPVSVYDFVVEQHNLNSDFFDGRPEKAKVWVMESQNINSRLDAGQSFGIEAPTGGGKTVMAQMSISANPRRTLFLVPIKRLAKRHQKLFLALGGKQQTRVITGETTKNNRQWFDDEDRIVFATGHVVVAELLTKPELLKGFDLVVFDEMHNAASPEHPYSQIARLAKELGVLRLGLSASPGNSKKQINKVLTNCCLNRLYKVKVPVSRQIASLIHTEEVSIPTHKKHEFILDFIKSEMVRSAYVLNSQAKSLYGVSSLIDPDKAVGYYPIDKIRRSIIELFPEKDVNENFHLFQDKSSAGKLMSSFEEYHKWEHIYNLAKTESYDAIREYYQNKILTKDSGYAKRIVKKGRVDQLLRLTHNSLHPKLEMLENVMSSVVRRGLQAIVFVSNKATAKAAHQHLTNVGIKCGLMLGGNSMTPKVQESVLEQMEDREIECIIATTVLREGFNLAVDVIINMTPPSSAIDQIQRSGRAGRNARNAEIVYLTTEEERQKVYSVDRTIKRLKLSDFSQFGYNLTLEESVVEVFDPNILEVESLPIPELRQVYQPSFF